MSGKRVILWVIQIILAYFLIGLVYFSSGFL